MSPSARTAICRIRAARDKVYEAVRETTGRRGVARRTGVSICCEPPRITPHGYSLLTKTERRNDDRLIATYRGVDVCCPGFGLEEMKFGIAEDGGSRDAAG